MWDFLLGEFRCPPRTAKYLSWPELDSILHGHAKATQTALIGPRLVAVQVLNAIGAFAEKHKQVQPADYLRLPLVDGPAKQLPKTAGPSPEFLARISARLGKEITIEA